MREKSKTDFKTSRLVGREAYYQKQNGWFVPQHNLSLQQLSTFTFSFVLMGAANPILAPGTKLGLHKGSSLKLYKRQLCDKMNLVQELKVLFQILALQLVSSLTLNSLLPTCSFQFLHLKNQTHDPMHMLSHMLPHLTHEINCKKAYLSVISDLSY